MEAQDIVVNLASVCVRCRHGLLSQACELGVLGKLGEHKNNKHESVVISTRPEVTLRLAELNRYIATRISAPTRMYLYVAACKSARVCGLIIITLGGRSMAFCAPSNSTPSNVAT
jgi:hypothetical protein